MNITYKVLSEISEKYGDAFYLLDSEQFRKNFIDLTAAFRNIYENSYIAYSYKTNYTPALCKIVDELGGYAEVVSDMEIEIAIRCGIKPEKIIFNGPYKNPRGIKELLLSGGTVNIDNKTDLEIIKTISNENPNTTLNVGIRCNFDIDDGVTSRFGFDTESKDFDEVLAFVNDTANVHLIGMHCHFASRRLDKWPARAKGMLELIDKRLKDTPEHIDLGGGIFGNMRDSLKAQFDSPIPSFSDYAKAAATEFAKHYENREKKPMLFIEPGSALAGDAMQFAAKVVNIKSIRGKAIATLLGSIYNINPTLNKKNPPLSIISCGAKPSMYNDLDFGGFTCIESDYLYRGFNGELAEGDFAVFENVGSYSVVLKPPFILPNFAIVDICDGDIKLIKSPETFENLFTTFHF